MKICFIKHHEIDGERTKKFISTATLRNLKISHIKAPAKPNGESYSSCWRGPYGSCKLISISYHTGRAGMFPMIFTEMRFLTKFSSIDLPIGFEEASYVRIKIPLEGPFKMERNDLKKN